MITIVESFDPVESDKMLCMCVGMHFSDISNPCKKWSICKNWIDILFVEFFAQGDKEKSLDLPISYLMDRRTINIAKA
jgi:hypothetical protein